MVNLTGISILDEVGYALIGEFQMGQHHLRLKVQLKSSTQDHIWSQKEVVSGTKHFYWQRLIQDFSTPHSQSMCANILF